jgi:hypothetical protein
MQFSVWKWISAITIAILFLANHAYARKIPRDWYLSSPWEDNLGPFKNDVGKRVTVHGWIGIGVKQGYSILVDDKSHIAIAIEALPCPKDGRITETITFTGWESARDAWSPERASEADRKRMDQNLLAIEHAHKYDEYVTAFGTLCHFKYVQNGVKHRSCQAAPSHLFFSVNDVVIRKSP